MEVLGVLSRMEEETKASWDRWERRRREEEPAKGLDRIADMSTREWFRYQVWALGLAIRAFPDGEVWRMKWSEEHDERVRLEERVKRLEGEVEHWKSVANSEVTEE